jgi:transcriptional regulator with GAF, ATPase, and Fis domain
MSADARDPDVRELESREASLMATFVTLADTLVAGYDVVDLLHTLVEACVAVLGVEGAGIVLSDPAGALHPIASFDGWSERVEVAQVEAGQGPCVESFLTGSPVAIDDIDASEPSRFREAARAAGYRSVLAVPLRLRTATIGALNLFGREAGALGGADAQVARALADVATIGILQARALRESDIAREQLQHALNSRVIIEQAKGVIAQSRSVDMDEAFRILRTYARSNNVALRDVADLVVRRSLKL